MKPITILPLLFLTLTRAVVYSTLTFGPVRQCEPVTVSFQSPSLPAGTTSDLSTTSLTILPFGLPPVVFPFTPRLTGSANTVVLTALPFPAQTRFLASLTDQLGQPLSKVSALLTIGASTTEGNTACLAGATRPAQRAFSLLENPAQCSDFTVWYNASTSSTSTITSSTTATATATSTSTSDSRRADPPRVRVYTPEGVELLLNNTSNTVTGEDGMARYTMSITAGKLVILMFDSGTGVREVTDSITVSGSSTSPSGCLQAERDALAALTPTDESTPTSTRPSNAIIIGAASGGAAVLIIALAMTFFIIRDRRQRRAQQERRERVIRRVRSMSFSGQNGRGTRGNTFLFPRPVRSSTFPGLNPTTGQAQDPSDEEKVESPRNESVPNATGLSKQPSYSNHPYAFSPRSSKSSYIIVDRPSSPSNPYNASQDLPLERDAPYQSRPSLGAQSEERDIPPMRFSRHAWGYEDPDRLSLTSLDIEGMLNMAQVQEDSGRSREGSIPTIVPDRRPTFDESRTSSDNVVPKMPSAEVSITVLMEDADDAGGSNLTPVRGHPLAIQLPTPPEPPLLRTRSRRTLKVNSDIPDGVFSATNSFISSVGGDDLGTGNDSDSMAGWSPVYPSAYFRSSAYPPPQPVSPGLEEVSNQGPSSSAQLASDSVSGVPSDASSFTKRILAPFPEGQATSNPESQPAVASSSSILPQMSSSSAPLASSRKDSAESTASLQNIIFQRGSTRDSSASGYAFPSPSAFPTPPSSIPTVQYPYRPPLQSAGSSSTFRSLPAVTTSFSQPSAATTSSYSQPSAALSSGLTFTTGASTYGLSPSEGGAFSPSSVPTLPAYSPLRDPPPFSALSPPSDTALSSMWSSRPALSPLLESEPSPSPASGSSSIQAGLRSLSPLVTSGISKQGSIRSSQLSMSPASVRLAARSDVRDVRLDAGERDAKRDAGIRKTPGGSLPVNYPGLPVNPRGHLRRGGSVSTEFSTSGTVSRVPSTIGEEFYGIAR